MKTKNLIALAMVGLALSFTPALAQRGGGGGSRSGGGHSSSSMSRSSGGGSSFSGSRSSSSSSSRSSSYSSPSRSSSSSSRSSSYSSPRSSSSSSSRGSYSSPSRSRDAYGSPRSSSSSSSRSTFSNSPRGRSGAASRSEARPASTRSGAAAAGRGAAPGGTRSGAPTVGRGGAPASGSGVRPSSHPGARSAGYARPGRPGPLPPSNRPIHPAPYFYHPWHGYVVHCHPVFWDPLPPRPWYWPGFWLYCNSYWYDYHVTDVVVVHDYVQQTYNVDMVTYGISGDVMYCIVRDHGDTYLQVYDKEDHLLAEQKIHRKYCNMVIDAESGGCWISKKGDKDPLLFLWADGQLLIYEAD